MEESEKNSKSNDLFYSQKRKFEEQTKKSYATTSPCMETSMNQDRILKSRGVCLPAAIADGLARHHAHEQLIYKQKLKNLKQSIRNIVLENAALCDNVASVQDELALALEERQYLLRKVMQIQLSTDMPHHDLKAFPDWEDEMDRSTSKKHSEEKTSSGHSMKSLFIKRNLVTNNGEKGANAVRPKSRLKKIIKIKRKCPPVPLDSSGRPSFPLHLGRLTIHSLGEIAEDKDGYHNENMIFPIGFCSSRMYASLKNPHQQTLYTCTIKEGGSHPRFDIVCDEDDVSFFGSSPSECHSQILKKINMILGIDLLPTSTDTVEADQRGLRFYGLSYPSVQNMIQSCLGAKKCSRYKWIHFEVCKTEAEADGVLETDREASICHETLLRNIRFASNHM